MEQTTINSTITTHHLVQFAKRLMTLVGNRLELLVLEVREEGLRLLNALLLGLGIAVLGFLITVTITGALVMSLWAWSPVGAFLAVGGGYALLAFLLYLRMMALLRRSKILPATLEQFRKDQECLKNNLS